MVVDVEAVVVMVDVEAVVVVMVDVEAVDVVDVGGVGVIKVHHVVGRNIPFSSACSIIINRIWLENVAILQKWQIGI